MKILNSNISFNGVYPQEYDNTGSFGPAKIISKKYYELKITPQNLTDYLEISPEAQKALAAEKAAETKTDKGSQSKVDELTIRICQMTIEGGLRRINHLKMISYDSSGKVTSEQEINYQNSDKVSFSASGIVNTADGKTIPITTELNISRDLFDYFLNQASGGDGPVSPMVFNFEGLSEELTTTKFTFDLDADGTPEQLSFVKNSGYLALDKNNDGIINDGKELFGNNSTGLNLAQYDSDYNGWIDKNDPIFDRLRIWSKDQEGNDILLGLGEKGIGAIYLGGLRLPLPDDNGLGSGVVVGGLYIKKDGTVGNMFQIETGNF